MSKDASVDEALLHKARRGDSAAFVEFASRWWTPVYRIAWNMLGSASEAAEATEQTLTLAVRFPESIGYDVPLGISLCGAAFDVTFLRCPQALRAAVESLDVFLPRFDARGRLASPGEDWSGRADGAFQRPDLGERIRGMLQRLHALDRAAFILREIEQFSVQETVAILRIPADEVRARSHRAVLLMTGQLAQMRRRPAALQASGSA
jgi:DNA-directed RNA polymerase specialized sigma24 family protein